MIRSDNCALLDILNKQNSKNKQVVSYSFLVLYLIQNNILIKAFHIQGEQNNISDAISRFQWDRLSTLLPESASRLPTPVREEFLRLFSLK